MRKSVTWRAAAVTAGVYAAVCAAATAFHVYLTRSFAGPMHIPMIVFVFPLACLLCLPEAGVLLLLRAVDRNTPRARRNRVMWKDGATERKG